MTSENTVLEIGYTEEVCCYFCREEQVCSPLYKRGEAYLALAGHSPLDGNAHYVCKEHLDHDAVIREPFDQHADLSIINRVIKILTDEGHDQLAAKSRAYGNYEFLKNSGRVILEQDLRQ